MEDVTSRTNLLKPLEEAVIKLPDAPAIPNSPAGKIANMLWFKNHPERADLYELLRLIDDESPLVRLSVAEVIDATLKSSHKVWEDPQFSRLAHQALVYRSQIETSPIVTYNLDKIVEKVSKLSRSRKAKRPKVILNPYVAGLPVRGHEKFFGRKEILKEINYHFKKKEGIKSIILYGARRTGKTSLLYQINEGALGEEFLPVYMDMQAFAGTTISFFLKTLIQSISNTIRDTKGFDVLSLVPPDRQEIEFPDVQKFLKRLLPELNETRLLLLIDEYEVLQGFFEKSNLDWQLQSLLETEPSLYAIFAGSRKLETLKTKRFLNLLDISSYIKISFLCHQDALQLIKEPANGLLQYVEGVPELILKYTGGHPFYTQLLCQLIFEQVKAGGVVKAQTVEDAIQQFLHNPSPHLILTWNNLDVKQKVAGAALAELSQDTDSTIEPYGIVKMLKYSDYPVRLNQSETQQALNNLCDIDWAEKKFDDETGTASYRFTMELVRQWIKATRSLWDLAEEQFERLYSKVAGFWKQSFALAIDFVIFGAVVALIRVIITNSPTDWEHWWFPLLTFVGLLYFPLPMAVSRTTLGQRLLNLRVVNAMTAPLKIWHAIFYGLVLFARLWLVFLLLYGLYHILNPATFSVKYLLMFLISAILTGVDILLVLFSQKRRGLFDRLTRTLIIAAEADDK